MSGTILVVDDNEMNRDMLSRRLQRQGYDVDIAVDGESALKCIDEGRYDLVLLDIMMPGMSGYQVLETLKGQDKTRHLPVIMISAVDGLDSVVRCIEMGAEDYLFKPFNPVLLKARVGATLAKHSKLQLREEVFQLAEALHDKLEALQAGGQLPTDSNLLALSESLKAHLSEIGQAHGETN